LVTVMRVFVAPSASSWARASRTSTARSPESIRIAPSSVPATRTAVAIPSATSKVSTRSVVPVPMAATCAANASSSVSCSSVNECAAVPIVGTPQVRPASRFDVAANPAMYAARAAAIADRSPVRRDPISASGRPSAAETIRAAAEATAES
jgi:hypothetical protein